MSEDENPNIPSSSLPWFSTLIVLTFIGLVLGYVVLNDSGSAQEIRVEEGDKALIPGELYYVFVESAEFAAQRPDGESWDLDDSAPDLAYSLSWKGKEIFQSSEVSDALIARWSGMKIGIEQALSLVKEGKTDPSQVINAALVRADEGGHLTLSFFDRDLAEDDKAADFRLDFERLKVGSNTLDTDSQKASVLHASLRVIKSQADLFKVLGELSRGSP
mgnify:CR=1 FL=1